MPDEPQPNQIPDSDADETMEQGAATAQETAADGDHDEDGGTAVDDRVDDEAARPRTIAMHNAEVIGQLVLHFGSRDVLVPLDGDAAIRVMTMFAQRREGGLADLLHPELSSATSGWLVLDLDEPLAMSWLPGLPTKRPRTAVDPAVDAA